MNWEKHQSSGNELVLACHWSFSLGKLCQQVHLTTKWLVVISAVYSEAWCLGCLLQGTILDRIDYNIEHSTMAVEKGLQQLQKAEKYQKKNRKMLCIMVLALLVVVLIIILIAVKS